MSQAPTAQQLFGDAPWVTDPVPGGVGPAGPYTYNTSYFATPATAALAATIVELGCKLPAGSVKVVEQDAMTQLGPYKQSPKNLMLQLPDGTFHFAGRIAKEFADWPSIETINADLTQELGMPFTFVMPAPPVKPVLKPVAGVELLVASIGGTAMQADGTTWKRVS